MIAGLTKILILEDNPDDALLIQHELESAGVNFSARCVDSRAGFVEGIEEFSPDIIIADFNLPQFNALDALQILKESGKHIPFLLVTGSQSEEVAVECMKQGADDYILKVSLKRLPGALTNALNAYKAERDREAAITALRRNEELLRQAQKLESIGRFAGTIAHDFNNILGIISGYAQQLERTTPSEERYKHSVEAIRRAASHGSGIVTELLAFARQDNMDISSFRTSTVAGEIVTMLQETFPGDITFILDLASELPLIQGDQNKFRQALLNLCVNARDAMPTGGTISVKTDRVSSKWIRNRFFDAGDCEYILLRVEDTGTGMDVTTKNRIFEPFFTTKSATRGTGLGLAVVYGVMKSHKGYIDVETKVGKGSIFSLYFPVDPGAASIRKKEKENGGMVIRSEKAILLIEDEMMLLDLLESLLVDEGFTVHKAATGKDALRLLKEYSSQIAVALTDVGLPDIKGLKLAKMMREISPKLKIIVASGYVNDASDAGVAEADVQAILPKPYNPGEVLEIIERVLGTID